MNAFNLPPDLERFADDAVSQGRFRDVAAVVRAGLTLLQQSEAELSAFAASLDAAKAEGEQLGFMTLADTLRDADRLLEQQDPARQ